MLLLIKTSELMNIVLHTNRQGYLHLSIGRPITSRQTLNLTLKSLATPSTNALLISFNIVLRLQQIRDHTFQPRNNFETTINLQISDHLLLHLHIFSLFLEEASSEVVSVHLNV